MGTFAVAHVPTMSAAEMDEYEAILNQETIDIFEYVTAKKAPPADIDTGMMRNLQDWAAGSPVGTSPESYAQSKDSANMT